MILPPSPSALSRQPSAVDVPGLSVNIAGMRMDNNEVVAIREEVQRLDAAAEIYLFGSRATDSARGGDIDLLVVSERIGFRELVSLRRAILDRIGWQHLDLVVRRRDELDEPLAAEARTAGVKL
jgi:uncharacterized protein